MRELPIWRCSECGHLVAHDLIDPDPPPICRGKLGCPGHYEADSIWEPGHTGWEEGSLEARQERMARSFGIYKEAIQRIHREGPRKRQPRGRGGA